MPIAALLVPVLSASLGLRVVTELPDDLAEVAPLVRLTPIGGSSSADLAAFTTPRISVDSFAVGYGPAEELANRVDDAFRELAGRTLGTSTITKVETVSRPAWVPYTDTALRHFVNSFQLHVMTR